MSIGLPTCYYDCRLIEEVREKAGVTLETDDVYMSTTFGAFIHTMITKSRGGDTVELEYDAVSWLQTCITVRPVLSVTTCGMKIVVSVMR